MKVFFVFLALTICSFSVFAQNDAIVKNAASINAVGFFTGFYKFNYERVISKKGSLVIGFGTGSLVNKSDADANDDFSNAFGSNYVGNSKSHTVKGFTASIDYRYYFTHSPIPKGLYVSSGIHYYNLNEKFEITNGSSQPRVLEDADYKLYNFKGLCGYQFLIAKRIIVNPFLGFGVIIGDVDGFYGTGSSFDFGINVGVGF